MSTLRETLEKQNKRVFDAEDELELLQSTRRAYQSYDLDGDNLEGYVENYNSRISKNYENLLNFNKPVNFESAKERDDAVEEMYSAQQMELTDYDLMPSSTTMQFSDSDFGEDVFVRRSEEEAKPKASLKTKIMIAVYAVVALTLLILIIINSVAISSLSSNIAIAQAEVNSLRADSVTASLALDEILNSGAPANMIAKDAASTLTLPAVRETAAAAETNMFDSICNFLCRIFG